MKQKLHYDACKAYRHFFERLKYIYENGIYSACHEGLQAFMPTCMPTGLQTIFGMGLET